MIAPDFWRGQDRHRVPDVAVVRVGSFGTSSQDSSRSAYLMPASPRNAGLRWIVANGPDRE